MYNNTDVQTLMNYFIPKSQKLKHVSPDCFKYRHNAKRYNKARHDIVGFTIFPKIAVNKSSMTGFRLKKAKMLKLTAPMDLGQCLSRGEQF